MQTEPSSDQIEAAENSKFSRKIPFQNIQEGPFKFMINAAPQNLDKVLMDIQTPSGISGAIPLFKVSNIFQIEEIIELKDPKAGKRIVKAQFFKVEVDTQYYIFSKECAAYREYLKQKFQLDLSPYLEAFDFGEN